MSFFRKILIGSSCFFLIFRIADAVTISPEITAAVAEKIWKNECNQSVTGLTHWNKGESFPSMGIGHFIWYPKTEEKPFEETFPQLLLFFQEHDVLLPKWLEDAPPCPWSSRSEFYQNFHSPKMRNLRQFLFEHQTLQAQFMAKRLERTLSEILRTSPEKERKSISHIVDLLIAQPSGCYALMDYVNFKGSGLSEKECYQGHRWGLLQVLQRMTQHCFVADFVQAGKEVLQTRTEKAPPHKEEARWLPGWFHRLDTYLDP